MTAGTDRTTAVPSGTARYHFSNPLRALRTRGRSLLHYLPWLFAGLFIAAEVLWVLYCYTQAATCGVGANLDAGCI